MTDQILPPWNSSAYGKGDSLTHSPSGGVRMFDRVEPSQLIDLMNPRETELVRTTAGISGSLSISADPEYGIVEVSNSGWPESVPLPSRDESRALETLGVVEALRLSRGWGFQINLAGRRVAGELERRARFSRPGAVDPAALQWPAVAPHRQSIHDEWFAQGMPVEGVTVESTSLAALDERTQEAVAQQLHDEDYVIYKPSSVVGFLADEPGEQDDLHRIPAYVRPSSRTVSEFGRWPTTPEVAQEQMLAAIDALLNADDTPEADKSKLAAVRENIGQMAAGTAWGLLMAQLGLPG